jgi:hypothetical protein
MRPNSKPDIRLEVPEQFRIYLMLDVISQRSGIARLCVCKRQMGTDDRGQMSASGSELPARREEPTDRREEPTLRAVRPTGWKRPRRESRTFVFANSPSPKATAKDGLWRGKRRTEDAGIAGRSRLETLPATTSMRLIMVDRAEIAKR